MAFLGSKNLPLKQLFYVTRNFRKDFRNDYFTEIFKAYFLGINLLNKDDHIIFVTRIF